ncbi:type II toxin-antitoxin system MqsA family antitoxin [Candidatus Pyrohabitans sp.]
MTCAICGGRLKEDRVKVELWVKDELIVIEDVPARVCEACGEKYFSAEVSKTIDYLISARPKAKKRLDVPVFTFKEAQATV